MKTFQIPSVCLVPLFFSALLSTTNAAAVLTPPTSTSFTSFNTTSFLDSPQHPTLLGTIDPRKFAAKTYYGERPLPATSVLMSAVDVMTQLALQDWESEIGPKTYIIDDPKYSQIEIFIGPSIEDPNPTIKVGFAVLGLFEVVQDILSKSNERFKSVVSSFSYDGREVGRCFIRRRAPVPPLNAPPTSTPIPHKVTLPSSPPISPIPPPFNATDPTSIDALPVSPLSALSAPAWADPTLTLHLTQDLPPPPLTPAEIFLTTLAILREIALFPSSRRMRDFQTKLDTPPITTPGQPMIAIFRDVRRVKSTGPFFEWGTVVKAVARLPGEMLGRGNFGGVGELVVKVRGVEVGVGGFGRELVGRGVQKS